MKCLLVVLSLAAVGLARPDIGLNIREGNYYKPSGSYIPAPSGNFGGDSHGFHSNQHSSSENAYTGGPSFHGSDLGSHNSQSGSTFQQSGGFNNGGYNQGFDSGSSGSNRYQSGSTGFNGAPVVNKYAYFYDAPEDHETPQLRIHSEGGAAQHSHKLIFVKAPAYKAPQIPQIPLGEQHQERTRVYVLIKKQDAIQDIVIPTSGPSKQNKPEVFFIKYKTQKEAEEQIHNIEQGGASGISAHAVRSNSDLVSTIQDTKESNQFDVRSPATNSFQNGGVSDGFQSGNVGSNDAHSQTSGNVGSYGGDHHGHLSSDANSASSSSSGSFSHGSTDTNNYGPAGNSGPY